jgi:serine protease Do
MKKTNKWIVALALLAVVVGFVGLLGPGIAARFTYAMQSAKAEVAAEKLQTAKELSTAFSQVAEVLKPSVVSIRSEKIIKPQERIPRGFEGHRFFGDEFFERFFNGRQPQQKRKKRGLGSGVIVSEDGYILTNAHVVKGADKVITKLSDKREIEAEVVGTDIKTDLAVIRIDANNLHPATLGDSDNLHIGEWVVAAGTPFGLSHTITTGIVSAKGRANVGIAEYEDFIQTDAAINPGNSGGPLVNLRGEVIGINTAILSASGGYMGIGFAIPSNMAESIMNSLIEKGKVVRGYIGVYMQDLTKNLARSFDYDSTEGVLVSDVIEDTPAAESDLQEGDIIVEYRGKQVKDINDLHSWVAETEPGTDVELRLFRDGEYKTIELTVGERGEEVAAAEEEAQPAENIGMAVRNLTTELAQRLGLETTEGVIVVEVEQFSIAAEAGIRPKDVIIRVEGEPVTNVREFRQAIAANDLDEGIRLVVLTRGMKRFVFLQSGK